MSSKEPRPLPKHTPGPWKIGPAQWRRGGPPYKIPISGPNGTIANVLTHDASRREGWGASPPEHPNADALLIASAPELQQRVDELEREAESMRGLLQASQVSSDRSMREKCSMDADNARLQSELSELRRLVNRHDHDYLAVHKELDKAHAENGSLRELLKECLEYLPLKGHTYNAMACQDSKLGDRIKAAIEKGE